MDILRHSLTRLGVLTTRPEAFLIFLAYSGLWVCFAPRSLDWHSCATLATWAMTLFIQRAEHRDTQAVHAKLDAILKVHGKGANLLNLDDKDAEEVERARDHVKASRDSDGRMRDDGVH